MFEAIGRAVEKRLSTTRDPREIRARIEKDFRPLMRRVWLGIIVVTVPFGVIIPIVLGDPALIPGILLGLSTIVVVIFAMTRRTMRTTYLWTLFALLLMALMIGAMAVLSN